MFTANKEITHATVQSQSFVRQKIINQMKQEKQRSKYRNSFSGEQPVLFALTHKMRQVHLGSSMRAR